MFIKPPIVEGMYYPKDPKELAAMIEKYMQNVTLPQLVQQPKAIIAPHAGYTYSGLIAAYSYKILEMCRNKLPKTFVIMTPNHHVHFQGVSLGLYDGFETPLGTIKVNKFLGERLLHDYPDYFCFNEDAYVQEHALEVQFPFLQYVASSDFQILPMMFGNVDPLKIGEILAHFLDQEDLFFIISTDLSHYLPQQLAQHKDKHTIDLFIQKDIENILTYGDACGIKPWLSITQLAIMKNWQPTLLKYQTSADTAGNREKVVGYGSLVYEQ